MIKHFLTLEWKSFARSASFKTNIAFKILMLLGFLYFATIFVFIGIGIFYGIRKEAHLEPLATVNRYLIYYFSVDLIFRYMMQKIPVVNIKPLLYLNLKKSSVVHFSLGKTALSGFNLLHAFFFIPFSVVMLVEGYDVWGVVQWYLGIMALIFTANFLNILAASKDSIAFFTGSILVVLAGLHYYGFFDITQYTSMFFNGLYHSFYSLIALLLLLLSYYSAANYFRANMFLDAGLSVKQKTASTQEYTWLNRFGSMSTFLKNDLRLILRNKRSKMTLFVSLMFLFYGLLFFTSKSYESPVWQIFAGIFVSGGFLFTFGQFVPSWDSSYYPLMMSQNIQYREYISSKWWLVVIATVFSTGLASFYLFFGWKTYLAVVVGAIYNIGVNAHLVLWGGAYIKQPIDLTSAKQAFGNKQAFNLKTMLLSIPKLLLPLGLFALGYYLINPIAGYLFVALAGVLGFAFKNKVFSIIEKIYQTEKYKTIAAYKQKN
ncbi:MAG: hypothetical protein CO119_05845 [Flavobacteriales bacterium CG_4_9_14_3_um_filter_40_17]|nr:MAG: hypothetical protein CO119_05845 [Flavobacteriales bacterium CG_4_9_14_3_um_filter_40_17]